MVAILLVVMLHVSMVPVTVLITFGLVIPAVGQTAAVWTVLAIVLGALHMRDGGSACCSAGNGGAGVVNAETTANMV